MEEPEKKSESPANVDVGIIESIPPQIEKLIESPPVQVVKKSSKDDRSSKKKDDKSLEHVLKALSSLGTTEEKLAAMCKKYTEVVDESRKTQMALKQCEKRVVQVTREKEQLQAEQSKSVLTRSRLENLCRELQKQNKAIKEESLSKIREEEEKRKEVSAKFQSIINEITSLTQQNNENNTKLKEENLEMQKKFKTVCEQYELREQQFEKLSKQMQLEGQLADAKLAKAKLEMVAEKEILMQEKKQLLLELTVYQNKCQELQATEIGLRSQISLYTDKYDEFQNALTKSNQVYGGFKGEMEKMSKKITKLEKETSAWKLKWEGSHKALLQMAADKQTKEVEYALQSRKLNQLQKLCRQLQSDRGALLTQLKNEGIIPKLPTAGENNNTNDSEGEEKKKEKDETEVNTQTRENDSQKTKKSVVKDRRNDEKAVTVNDVVEKPVIATDSVVGLLEAEKCISRSNVPEVSGKTEIGETLDGAVKEKSIPSEGMTADGTKLEKHVLVNDIMPEKPMTVNDVRTEKPVVVNDVVEEAPVVVNDVVPVKPVTVNDVTTEKPVVVNDTAAVNAVTVNDVVEKAVTVIDVVKEKSETSDTEIKKPVTANDDIIEKQEATDVIAVDKPVSVTGVGVENPIIANDVVVDKPVSVTGVGVENAIIANVIAVDKPVSVTGVVVENPLIANDVVVDKPVSVTGMVGENSIIANDVVVDKPVSVTGVRVENPIIANDVVVDQSVSVTGVVVENPVIASDRVVHKPVTVETIAVDSIPATYKSTESAVTDDIISNSSPLETFTTVTADTFTRDVDQPENKSSQETIVKTEPEPSVPIEPKTEENKDSDFKKLKSKQQQRNKSKQKIGAEDETISGDLIAEDGKTESVQVKQTVEHKKNKEGNTGSSGRRKKK